MNRATKDEGLYFLSRVIADDEPAELLDAYKDRRREDLEDLLSADLVIEVEPGVFAAEWYGSGVFTPRVDLYVEGVKRAGFTVIASGVTCLDENHWDDDVQVVFTKEESNA